MVALPQLDAARPGVTDVLRAYGGSLRWRVLRRLVSRSAVTRALAEGSVVRDRGVYALPDAPEARRLAQQYGGAASHTSAARHWGLALPTDGPQHVTIRRRAKRTRPGVSLHYRELRPDEVRHGVTTPLRTVLDCARDLPLRVALAVGDSALRQGLVSAEDLARSAHQLRGPGSRRARQVVAWLDARAANAFESAMRAILLEGGLLGFVPQVVVWHGGRFLGRVDLAHLAHRVIVECDSFRWHGDRAALARDARRYVEFVAHGWRVLRFAWEHVIHDAAWVLDVVTATLDGGTGTSR